MSGHCDGILRDSNYVPAMAAVIRRSRALSNLLGIQKRSRRLDKSEVKRRGLTLYALETVCLSARGSGIPCVAVRRYGGTPVAAFLWPHGSAEAAWEQTGLVPWYTVNDGARWSFQGLIITNTMLRAPEYDAG